MSLESLLADTTLHRIVVSGTAIIHVDCNGSLETLTALPELFQKFGIDNVKVYKLSASNKAYLAFNDETNAFKTLLTET